MHTSEDGLALSRAKSKPSILGEREYNIDVLGYKYHMNDLAALSHWDLVIYKGFSQRLEVSPENRCLLP